MKHLQSLLRPIVLSCAAMSVSSALAQAEGYPSKSIRIITPFVAGATTDVLSRIISEKMSANWGQPVVVDNKPGAAGLVGTEAAARAPADGYTVVNVISSHMVHKHLVKKVPFDAVKDFEPVILLARTPLVLVVENSMPVKTVPEFIEYARQRANTGKPLSYGTSGLGSAVHLTTELFGQTAKVKMDHVPYKGGAQALQDLLGGHVPVVMSGLYTVSNVLQAGKIKPIFVTTATRVPNFPNIPTLQESGFPGLVEDEWWAILAPAGTPKAIVNKLNVEITRIFNLPDVKERIAKQDIEFIGGTPEDLLTFMKAKAARWDNVLNAAGIKAK